MTACLLLLWFCSFVTCILYSATFVKILHALLACFDCHHLSEYIQGAPFPKTELALFLEEQARRLYVNTARPCRENQGNRHPLTFLYFPFSQISITLQIRSTPSRLCYRHTIQTVRADNSGKTTSCSPGDQQKKRKLEIVPLAEPLGKKGKKWAKTGPN